jgi:two-component system response regulator MprA
MMARVLVVDDDPHVRYMLECALEAGGHSVVAAEDGNAALRLAAESRPEAVVLDLMMPGMDGFQFLEVWRSQAHSRDVPVVVVSAVHDLREAVGRLQPYDVRACLPKPFDLNVLLGTLERLTQQT